MTSFKIFGTDAHISYVSDYKVNHGHTYGNKMALFSMKKDPLENDLLLKQLSVQKRFPEAMTKVNFFERTLTVIVPANQVMPVMNHIG